MSVFTPLRPLRRLAGFLGRLRAIRALHGVTDADRLLQFFEPPSPGVIFKPLQKAAEIRELLLRVRELRPGAILEIGTNNGGTLFLFCRVAAADATAVSIDLPGGMFGGGYSVWRIPYYKAFATAGQRVRLLRRDSHSPTAVACVRRSLGGRPLDFLFIDGDHSFAGVRQDFLQYGPLVRPGGLIAFHDIRTKDPETGGGVPRLWEEIKGRYQHEEIVEKPEDDMMGIGLIRVPGGDSPLSVGPS